MNKTGNLDIKKH